MLSGINRIKDNETLPTGDGIPVGSVWLIKLSIGREAIRGSRISPLSMRQERGDYLRPALPRFL